MKCILSSCDKEAERLSNLCMNHRDFLLQVPDNDDIRIELAAILRDHEPGVQHSLATADAIMKRFELRKK